MRLSQAEVEGDKGFEGFLRLTGSRFVFSVAAITVDVCALLFVLLMTNAITFLRVTPPWHTILTQIVSDVLSPSLYGMCVRAFYLTFFLAFDILSDIFLAFKYLCSIYFDIFSGHSIWHMFKNSIWHFFRILSGMLSNILSGILSGVLPVFRSRHAPLHPAHAGFGSRCAPLDPRLAI